MSLGGDADIMRTGRFVQNRWKCMNNTKAKIERVCVRRSFADGTILIEGPGMR